MAMDQASDHRRSRSLALTARVPLIARLDDPDKVTGVAGQLHLTGGQDDDMAAMRRLHRSCGRGAARTINLD